MTNYVKFTNFTVKDSLPTGDTNKVIRGSEFDTEFDAIATAVSTKSNIAGPTFTGTATFADVSILGSLTATTGTFSGAVTGSNLNVSNWDTAYGWGDHATQGYLTSVAFSDISGAAVITSSETFVSNDTTLPTTATLTARILAASLGPTASLDDLNDVDLTTSAPTDGEVLVYNASTSNFIPGSAGSVDGGFANSTYVTGQTINGGTA